MENMESSSRWVVDTSLDLNINSYFKNHQDHHKEEFVFQGDLGNLQVNYKESSLKEEFNLLVMELDRINSENQKLNQILTCMHDKYNELKTHFMELMKDKNIINSSNSDKQVVSTTLIKRKATNDGFTSDEDTNCKRPKQEDTNNKVSRVLVRADASNVTSLVVKDGFQWRKYGQKVTRDNPSPRAYFKCSFSPTCPVKKKVQRSVENPSVLVATYEGEHNHLQPCRAEFMFSTNQGCASMSPPPLVPPENNNNGEIFQQFLVQQMANSLTKDPNFTAAIAAAISGRFLDHSTPNV